MATISRKCPTLTILHHHNTNIYQRHEPTITEILIKTSSYQLDQTAKDAFGWVTDISVPVMFIKIGLAIILAENVLHDLFHALAFTPFTTRSIIGVHLWPSQIWFIFIGNAIAAAMLFKHNFKIPERFRHGLPIIVVLTVYTLWTGYGIIRGNDAATGLFREMVMEGLAFPGFLYMTYYVKIEDIFPFFLKVCVVVYTMLAVYHLFLMSIFPIPDMRVGLLLFAGYPFAYYLHKSIRNVGYLIPSFLMFMPAVVIVSKPLIVYMLMIPVVLAFVLTTITKKQLKYSINTSTIKLIFVALLILVGIIFVGWYINEISNGRVMRLISDNFLKIRATKSGELYMGDLSGGRTTIWANAFKIWQENKLFGNGLGTAVPIRGETIAHIHNYTLQALMDTGLVGFSILFVAWFTWFKHIFRNLKLIPWDDKKNLYSSYLTFIIGYFIYAIFGLPLFFSASAYFFWMGVAFLTNIEPGDYSQNKSKGKPDRVVDF